MSSSPNTGAIHSPDGFWWWSGQEWLRAVSPDGRTWFDGRQWVTRPGVRPPSRPWSHGITRRMWGEGAVWLVLLGLWCPVLAGLAEHHASASILAWVGGSLGGLAVVATLGIGGRLGYRRLWRPAAVACIAGTSVLVFWFVMITLAAPDPTNQNDHAAGAGAVILAVPTAVVLATMLGLGASVGGACSWVRDRRRLAAE